MAAGNCKNCGAVIPPERGKSPFCSDSCKEAAAEKK